MQTSYSTSKNRFVDTATPNYDLPAKTDNEPGPQKSPTRMSASSAQSIPIPNTVVVSSMVFDPNNSTPPSDFMNLLKHRMNVYFVDSIQPK